MKRFLVLFMLSLGTFFQGGCAAIFDGTSDRVVIETIPAGRSFTYKGVSYNSGDSVTIHKEFKEPYILYGKNKNLKAEIPSDVNAWLIGDCALLLFFFIPGLIALGVDFGTGAWREYNLDAPIVIPVADG